MSKKQPKVYLIYCKFMNLYKIGISINPEKRIKQLQTGTPYELSIIAVYESKCPFKVEKILHNTFLSKKTPDNFKYDFEWLNGEWFNLTTQDVVDFVSCCENTEKRISNLKMAGNPFV